MLVWWHTLASSNHVLQRELMQQLQQTLGTNNKSAYKRPKKEQRAGNEVHLIWYYQISRSMGNLNVLVHKQLSQGGNTGEQYGQPPGAEDWYGAAVLCGGHSCLASVSPV